MLIFLCLPFIFIFNHLGQEFLNIQFLYILYKQTDPTENDSIEINVNLEFHFYQSPPTPLIRLPLNLLPSHISLGLVNVTKKKNTPQPFR